MIIINPDIRLHELVCKRKAQTPKRRCSLLFPLLPCGSNSELQESFPSYLDRLSALHAAPIRPFLRTIVHSYVGWKNFDVMAHVKDLLVGYGEAGRVVDFIAVETTVSTVRLLVPVFLRDLDFSRPNLRDVSAWCPECLDDWRRRGLALYRPLVWSISFVTYCPVHWVEIETRCPACCHHLDYFGPRHWDGHCSACGSWLGTSSASGRSKCAPSEFERSCAKRIAEICYSEAASSDNDDLDTFRKNVEMVIRCVGLGAFCRISKFSAKTLRCWRKAKRKPQLRSLLRLGYWFNVPLNDWLKKEMTDSDLKPVTSLIAIGKGNRSVDTSL